MFSRRQYYVFTSSILRFHVVKTTFSHQGSGTLWSRKRHFVVEEAALCNRGSGTLWNDPLRDGDVDVALAFEQFY